MDISYADNPHPERVTARRSQCCDRPRASGPTGLFAVEPLDELLEQRFASLCLDKIDCDGKGAMPFTAVNVDPVGGTPLPNGIGNARNIMVCKRYERLEHFSALR